jgi:hypothetical protein
MVVRALLVSLCVSLIAGSANAAPPVRRFALVVGSNRGLTTDQVLHYAEADAARMAAVLGHLGNVPRGALFELYTPTASQLYDAIDHLATRARAARADGASVLVLFYFSGHSDGEALHTHDDVVPFVKVRRAFKDSGAPVRLLIVDACRAGALTRRKGATAAPPLEVQFTDPLSSEGEAFIASATSDELARESSMLRGSFFTHHFVSGLRGAADRSGDGRVTLAEAYDYAYARTVVEAGGEQHPTYAFDMTGRGEVVLTSVWESNAALQFGPAPRQAVMVVNAASQEVVAELKLDPTVGVRVALPPGTYEVRYGVGGAAHVQTVVLAARDLVDVAPPAPAPAAPKVAPVTKAAAPLPKPAPLPEPAPVPKPIVAQAMGREPKVQLLVGVGLGTGLALAFADERSEVAWQKTTDGPYGPTHYQPMTVQHDGFLPVRLHVRIDVGVRLVRRWEILASLREQVYVGANAESHATGPVPLVDPQKAATTATSGLLRLRRRFPIQFLAPFVELAMGGGQIRPLLDSSGTGSPQEPLVDRATAQAFNADSHTTLRQVVCSDNAHCTDSIAMGYVLFGVGGGLQMELFRRERAGLELSMSTTLLGVAGGGQPGLVADFDLGLIARVF